MVIDSLHTGLNYSDPIRKPKSFVLLFLVKVPKPGHKLPCYNNRKLDLISIRKSPCYAKKLEFISICKLPFFCQNIGIDTFAVFTGPQNTKILLVPVNMESPRILLLQILRLIGKQFQSTVELSWNSLRATMWDKF
jgi:hypothetical protein